MVQKSKKVDKSNKSNNVGGIVAGVAALSAAAVGAYYLYGHKDAKKHRSAVKGWTLKAKGEVLEELEKVKEVTETTYESAVDAIAKKYNKIKHISPEELELFIGEMKDHWTGIKKSLNTKKTSSKVAKVSKTSKPAAKTASKKTSR